MASDTRFFPHCPHNFNWRRKDGKRERDVHITIQDAVVYVGSKSWCGSCREIMPTFLQKQQARTMACIALSGGRSEM